MLFGAQLSDAPSAYVPQIAMKISLRQNCKYAICMSSIVVTFFQQPCQTFLQEDIVI